jgi:hypothetical protein
MVKRGGKEVITVEIFKETYEAMKVIANKKRWSTKDYINTALVEAIERDKFLQSYAPSLSKIVYEDDTLFILDAKLGKTAEIYLRNRVLYCNVCECKDCVCIFTMLLPCQKLPSSICVGWSLPLEQDNPTEGQAISGH